MINPHLVDFEIISDDNDYGEYFQNTNRILVFLKAHAECVENIPDTIHHELLHKCVTDILDDDIDLNQEHKLIRHVIWAEKGLIL